MWQFEHQGQDNPNQEEHEAPVHQVVMPAAGAATVDTHHGSLIPGHGVGVSGPRDQQAPGWGDRASM
jgi:hypothetical protein